MATADPATAHTAEEFVVLLRHVRDESGLTFWEIEERAAAHGIQLDPAAVVEALGGDELPEDALVAGLLLACGVTGRQLDRWMRIHEELSYVEPDEVLPVQPGRRRLRVAGRRWKAKHLLIALVTAAVVVVAGVALTAMWDGPAMIGAPSPNPATPSLDAASPSPSPSAPSPTRSPARPSAPAGALPAVTLAVGQGVDLDTGQTSGDGLDVVATADGMRAGDNGKRLALMPAGTTPSKDTCDSIVPGQLDRAIGGLSVGRSVCVKTDQGRWARLSITGTGASLKFSYLLWS